MQNILVIDDNLDNIFLVELCLEGIAKIHSASTISEAILLLNVFSFDLILLDINLPDGNGLDLGKLIFDSEVLNSTPFMVLSCHNEIEQKVKAFQNGAVDYLSKPYDIQELRARVEFNLLRLHRKQINNVIKISGLEIDQTLQSMRIGQDLVSLTHTEFKILMVLIASSGNEVKREIISDKVWGLASKTNLRQIDTQISKLRKKIGLEFIKSVHGVGYKFVA